jgi:hypothetical protein
MQLRIYRLATVALSAFALSGCFVSSPSSTSGYTPSDGTLILDWSIDGTKDPNQCVQAQVDAIDITVFATGDHVGTAYTQHCETFATSIILTSGDYSADVVLVTAHGSPRTTTLAVHPFVILGNDELTIPIDFPADSFLQ